MSIDMASVSVGSSIAVSVGSVQISSIGFGIGVGGSSGSWLSIGFSLTLANVDGMVDIGRIVRVVGIGAKVGISKTVAISTVEQTGISFGFRISGDEGGETNHDGKLEHDFNHWQ